MKTKSFTLMIASILAMVFLVNLASASTVLDIANTTVIPTTLNPGESFTVTLNVTYTGSSATGVDLTWAGVSPSDTSFWTLPTLTHLDAGQSATTTFKFSAPSDYTPGTINAVLRATGAGSTPDDFTFTTTINEVPKLSVTDATIAQGKDSTTVTITNKGNKDLSGISLTVSGDFKATLSETSISSLAIGESTDVTVTVNEDTADLVGANSVEVTATAGTVSAKGEVTLTGEYCEYSDNGNLKLVIDDISVSGFGGDEDNEWFPLDEVEVTLNIENKGNEKIKNIEVEWGLYNTETKEWVFEEKESDFSLADGDDKDITLSFTLDDVDEYDGSFIFYARATGEDKEVEYNKTCTSDSESIDMIIESDFVILNNIEYPDTALCGMNAQITADIWNIGEEDQEDLYVKVYNKELGLEKEIDFDKIKAFKREELVVDFVIPKNLEEGAYPIKFTIYDEDGDIYENDYDEDLAQFTITMNLAGGCVVNADAAISATLGSEAKAGEDLVVKTTITNTGSEQASFNVQASNYNAWATLVEQSKNTVTLAAGQSEEVVFTFKVGADVSGSKTFEIMTLSNNGALTTQPMTISIEKKAGFLNGITGNVINKDNWYFWGIGALNVLLVLVIILVAVRLVRRSRA